MPELSIVIPAHNAAATLQEQLAALARQHGNTDYEIVVVDNGSTDRTAEIANTMDAAVPIKVVEASQMHTPGYARNAGVRATDSPLLGFCDADDVVRQGFVDALAESLRDHDVVQGLISYERLNPAWMHRMRGNLGMSSLEYYNDIYPYVVTASLGVRRESFEHVGGFDEAMRFGQDVEYSWRLFQAGIDVSFDERVAVDYRFRRTAKACFRQSQNYGRARMEIRRRMTDAGYEAGGIRWRNILWLIRRAPFVIDKSWRFRWLFVAANLLGEIRGPAELTPVPPDLTYERPSRD